jgi:hypothetical protein
LNEENRDQKQSLNEDEMEGSISDRELGDVLMTSIKSMTDYVSKNPSA